jgi:hypothetical protein
MQSADSEAGQANRPIDREPATGGVWMETACQDVRVRKRLHKDKRLHKKLPKGSRGLA